MSKKRTLVNLCRSSSSCILLGIFLLLSQVPAIHAGEDFNQQIDLLAGKLASSSRADVLKGSETQVYISIGQDQGVLPGNRFEIVRLGEPLKVGDEIIGYEETPVAEVEVSRAREKLSICKVLKKTDIPKVGDKAHQLRKTINSLVVGQFSYNQSFNRLTKSLQEKLVTAMAGKGIQVVERSQLEKVLKEQKLGYSGLINTSSAKKIGQLLGADGIMLGTVNDMGDSIAINARLVDLENGKTVSATEVELPKTPLIAQLLDIPVADNPFAITTSSSRRSKSSGKKNKQQIQEVDGFSFALKQCKKSGTVVSCNVTVTNNKSDRKIAVYSSNGGWAQSTLFDNFGNAYAADRVQLANCDENSYCEMRLIKGVPTKLILTFNGVASDAERVSVLELTCQTTDHYTVQFRDINFKK